MINGRTKGAAAEREAGKWLQESFSLPAAPHRNLEQVREGGYDLLGFEPFAMEIKRVEQLSLNQWWLQALKQAQHRQCPVVMYRQNRQPWRFLIPATAIGVRSVSFVQLEANVFIAWAKPILEVNG